VSIPLPKIFFGCFFGGNAGFSASGWGVAGVLSPLLDGQDWIAGAGLAVLFNGVLIDVDNCSCHAEPHRTVFKNSYLLRGF
jgi:hypothetical protein